MLARAAVATASLATWVQATAAEEAVPIIPGAVGFGMKTPAGSGRHLVPPRTTVCRVTNLNDTGPGSLRAALDGPGPRTVVFEVSGTIDLKSRLGLPRYTTLAGQTAPSPGITLKGTEIGVGSDCLIQHIRIRVGDAKDGPDPNERDCMGMGGSHIVVDHCSFSWSIDELVDTRADKMTFRHCIFSEALHSPMHPKGPHSRGLFVMESKGALIVGNLFAHNAARNPVVGGSDAIVMNNFVYNYRGSGIKVKDLLAKKTPTRQSIVANSIVTGADSEGPNKSIQLWGVTLPQSRVCIRGNLIAGKTHSDDWEVIWLRDVNLEVIRAEKPPVWIEGLEPIPAAQVEQWVLANAGARPADVAFSKLSLAERTDLALTALREGSAVDHLMAAFYLRASGNEPAARAHAAKCGAFAELLETFFERPDVPEREDEL